MDPTQTHTIPARDGRELRITVDFDTRTAELVWVELDGTCSAPKRADLGELLEAFMLAQVAVDSAKAGTLPTPDGDIPAEGFPVAKLHLRD